MSLETFLDSTLKVESSSGNYIGIGWAFLDETADMILESHNGVKDGDLIHCPYPHSARWKFEALRKWPSLKNFSYTYLPRYRVYLKDNRPHVIGYEPLLRRFKFQDHITNLYKLTYPVFNGHDHYVGMDLGPDFEVATKTVNCW